MNKDYLNTDHEYTLLIEVYNEATSFLEGEFYEHLGKFVRRLKREVKGLPDTHNVSEQFLVALAETPDYLLEILKESYDKEFHDIWCDRRDLRALDNDLTT